MSQNIFRHTPLNLSQESIRLIRITYDLSPDGHIQCELRQATIKDTYICLSYVWGGEFDGTWILLNGQRFWVRANLWSFLDNARFKQHISWIWIDAICIDQANPGEKVHQVQQMGRIYSEAERVICWLGPEKQVARHLTNPFCDHKDDRDKFRQSAYWTRAWIVQEISLARSITFMADGTEIDMTPESSQACKCGALQRCVSCAIELEMLWIDSTFSTRTFLTNSKHQKLMFLLNRYENKQCTFLRDRIFSLLAVCVDKPDIKIDYDIPEDELAIKVLTACSYPLCLCSVKIVVAALELSTSSSSVSSLSKINFAKWSLPLRALKRTVKSTDLFAEPATAFYTCMKNWKFQDRVTVAIHLGHICHAFDGWVLEIRYRLGHKTFTPRIMRKNRFYKPSRAKVYRQYASRDSGVQQEFSADGERCTVSFSFGFLVEVISPLGWRGALLPCQSVTKGNPPVLELCNG
jgi:hypothetical protein